MLTPRQNQIVSFLKTRKHAKVEEIAQLLFTSESTARREIAALQRIGIIRRTHGGASIVENAEETPIVIRQVQRVNAKKEVAELAADKLPNFTTLFIDNSSTARILVQQLPLKNKTVVTNGVTVAVQLAADSDTNVHLLGGRYHYHASALIGDSTVKAIEQMQFNLMLCSCTSLSADGAFESSEDQCAVKRAALANSRYKILLADSSKLNDNAMYRTGNLTDFDLIVTNAPKDALQPLLAVAGDRIVHL